jgi:DNA-3-methyladenine glycosylase
MPLAFSFYERPTLMVARDLVGTILIVEAGGRRISGRIVEVEGYLGEEDPASHAGRGPTPRSQIMFGRPGVAYVYLIYGVHHCLNVVTEPAGRAGAILIRALEPLEGCELMARRRGRRRPAPPEGVGPYSRLCSGPGKLCQALGIDLRDNGASLCGGPRLKRRRIWLERGDRQGRVRATPRIGVRRAADRFFRFVDPDSDSLSVPVTRARTGA